MSERWRSGLALVISAVVLVVMVFIGPGNEDSEAVIAAIGRVKRLGRLPLLDPLTPESLAAAFSAHFDPRDFTP